MKIEDFDYIKRLPDGSLEFYNMIKVGGRDENGDYELVLDDGPAQGEKVYIVG